jgi:dimethylglycine dehydrogenase
MMVEGEAEIDMASLDPKRYGSWMTTEYAARKNEECYDHVFILHHPDEEREACRPLRTSPAYDRQKARGAQFGQINGWDRPNYYGPIDAPANFDHDSRSFRRGGWWKYAVEEAKAIRETAGLIDATAFTKHLVRGPGATAFLDWFTCNTLPKVGRINLTYALTPAGTTRTEYTIVRNGENDYYLVSAGAWTAYDADYLRKCAEDKAPEFGYIEIHDVTTQWGVFALAGPEQPQDSCGSHQGCRSGNRPVKQAFPVAFGPQDRAWHVPCQRDPRGLHRRTWLGVAPPDRDAELPVRPADEGGREARVETGRGTRPELAAPGKILSRLRQRTWPRCDAARGRLPRFVDMNKDFQGKQAMIDKGIRSMCVTVLIDGPADADPWGKEALMVNGKKVGRLTSGGYSVAFGKQIGMGYVRPELATPGTKLQVRMLRQLWDAVVTEDSPFDPKNERIRVDG